MIKNITKHISKETQIKRIIKKEKRRVRMVCAYKLLTVRKKKIELFLHFGLKVRLELMLCFKNKETEWHLVNPKTKGR